MNSKFVCNILSEKITTSYLSCPFMTATILLTVCEFLSEQDKEEVKHELEPHELMMLGGASTVAGLTAHRSVLQAPLGWRSGWHPRRYYRAGV